MNRHILYVSSYNESVIKSFSGLLRALGRRMQEALWCRHFSENEEMKDILYLDSSGRGNLGIMARSMGESIIEYVFFDHENKRRIYLISELLKTEYIDGEYALKSLKANSEILEHRIKSLDERHETLRVTVVKQNYFECSPLYSFRKSLVRKAIIKGSCEEKAVNVLWDEDVSDVFICDAFNKSAMLSLIEKRLGIKPSVIHIMNEAGEIYAPFMCMENDIFMPTERFYIEALSAICLWLSSKGLTKCDERLYEAFLKSCGNENFLENTEKEFMEKIRVRKKRKE